PEPPTTNKWQLDNWLTKSSSKAPRVPSEGPHAGKRSCQKSPAQQEPPQRQTVGSKQPKKPVKASAPGHADARASLLVESEPGLPPQASKDQPSKDKPKVKTKGRPRAAESREPKPEDRRKDKPLVPLRDTKLLSPLRDTPLPQSLMVKITLDLLSRIPQPPGKGSRPKKPEDKQPSAGKKPDSEKRSSENSSKLAKKRKVILMPKALEQNLITRPGLYKASVLDQEISPLWSGLGTIHEKKEKIGEAERDHDSKKIRLEKEVKSQSSPSSSHKESSKSKTPRPSSEPSKKEMLPPSLVSSSSSSSQKPAKPAQKRSRQEADLSGQDPPKSASSTKGNHRDSSVSKHRKVEGKGSGSSTEHKGSSGDAANRFPVPSLPNGNSKPGKPHMKLDKQQADFHMKEAKRLKDKAELVTDKVGKAFKYLEAALSFIECGIAMELESPASKSACSIYAETLDLINMRCQSILNMAMFRCKKDIAIKYSRTLNEHFFKTSSKVAQAPSPCIA
ncbi:hypothetical protein E2I00_000482, partial [Balaenoptera physalus]